MLELVAGYPPQDADGYSETRDRLSFGVNWFLKAHDAKVQLTYCIDENVNGVQGDNLDKRFLQARYVL